MACLVKPNSYMSHFSLKGLGVALVTPFKADLSIDYPALRAIIKNICQGGADFLVVLGTTGESPTLTSQEAEDIREFVRNETSGCIPLVLGVGGNCTEAVVQRLRNADLAGYSAILSVCPFYNKPSQEGMYRHFRAVAEASPLPIIIYNIPGRTGVNMQPETILRLANECPGIIGVKEASGSVDAVSRIVAGKPDWFEVVSGDDALTLPMMSVGATGVISVIGNAFTTHFATLVHAAATGDYCKAAKLHKRFAKLYKLMFAEGNPAGIKCALSLLGRCENRLRLPLVPVSDGCKRLISDAIRAFEENRLDCIR